MGSQNVTLVDTATHEVIATKPLGAGVRWLSNEQDFFDGRHIWTYDLVGDTVEVIVIDPIEVEVVKRIPIGKGPAHSVMLTPDRKYALANAAGDDLLAVIDTATYQIAHKIPTGKFPCDLDFSPDGTVGYFPERDQDTVASLDLRTFQILKRVSFPQGSKPHMLRVAPDGKTVWLQAAQANINAILDPQTLEARHRQLLGRVPVTNAFTPDGRFGYVTHFEDNFVSVIDTRTFLEVKRIVLAPKLGNVTFRPDGTYAYVSVISANAVAVIDTATYQVVKRIPAGKEPWGLIVFPGSG